MPNLVFLLDVDNTLLNNDQVKEDLAARLLEILGSERATRFWDVYEQVRVKRQFVDLPLTAQRMAEACRDPDLERRLLDLFDAIPFASYLYPHAVDALHHLQTLGTAVILSDGDRTFQPHKIKISGLEAAVDGNVLITTHKENELGMVFDRYPAERYTVVDDKPQIIAAFEVRCPTDFTTVLVLQGKYAENESYEPKADWTISRIGELCGFTRSQFMSPPRRYPDGPSGPMTAN